MRWNIRIHGYGGYTGGCRCSDCKKGKADYMRKRRRQAQAVAAARRVAGESPKLSHLRTHGRVGYEEHGCRCFTCRLANRQAAAV